MTNIEIIERESQRLAAEGVIGYTGREIKAHTPDGQEVVIKETEPIHTYQRWKELGFQVKKGEHAKAKFCIWKYKAGKHDEVLDVDEKGKMFMKMSAFFTAAQVEAI